MRLSVDGLPIMASMPKFMPVFCQRFCFLVLCLWSAHAGLAYAHQVPSMTMEADFAPNRGFTVRINFDPRLFLSDQPTSLPPVPASWYTDQSQAEKDRTHEQARAYLNKNLALKFGEETTPLPELKLEAIDGADSTALKPDTAEVHLLATGRSILPGSAADCRVSLGREANVSLILLQRVKGQAEASPRVIFPGETSQSFPLTGVQTLDQLVSRFDGSAKNKDGSATSPWIIRGILFMAVVVVWMLSKKKRAAQALFNRRGRR